MGVHEPTARGSDLSVRPGAREDRPDEIQLTKGPALQEPGDSVGPVSRLSGADIDRLNDHLNARADDISDQCWMFVQFKATLPGWVLFCQPWRVCAVHDRV